MKKPRIIYFGTPEFAVSPLEALVEKGYDTVAVVTAPDQPSGRGLHLQASPVKRYATAHNIPVLQPDKLKTPDFLEELRSFRADLFIVVAFRMLPEAVWGMPPLGTFNLHASLLPQYRGAAPIHHAIMNGETETGLTTFFLRQEIDTGAVIFQEKISILPMETTGELHDRMKIIGAQLVIRTVEAIASGEVNTIEQKALQETGEPLKPAPKIYREDCRIDWTDGSDRIINKVRGLNPVPAAFTTLISTESEEFQLKIFKVAKTGEKAGRETGTLLTDGKHFISVVTGDGALDLIEVQLAGKRRMHVEELLRGFRIAPGWKLQ